MSTLVLAGIAVAGGLGAVVRFLVDGAVADRLQTSFPSGTFVVNLSGALALGILAGAVTGQDTLDLAATGLLGSYTTFSTWMLEGHRLGEDGEAGLALLNFALSLGLGVGLAWIGLEIGASL